MLLSSLSLQNFRNFGKIDLNFLPGITGILGDNAQGKTNLLEAIFLLSCGSSWRVGEERELISFGEGFARIDGRLGEGEELALVWERDEQHQSVKKAYLVNGIRRKKETFTSHFPVVLFSPEDIIVVVGSPSIRRKLLDWAIVEAFPHYGRVLAQYGKVITARNKL
jgi:DNA replication and repair protein RecF